MKNKSINKEVFSNEEEYLKKIKKFLYDTQVTRKVSLWHFLFLKTNMIIIAFAVYLIDKYGEDALLYVCMPIMLYIMWAYKKTKFYFTFKITKAASGTFFSFMGNVVRRIYSQRRNALYIDSALGEMILFPKQKNSKRKGIL